MDSLPTRVLDLPITFLENKSDGGELEGGRYPAVSSSLRQQQPQCATRDCERRRRLSVA